MTPLRRGLLRTALAAAVLALAACASAPQFQKLGASRDEVVKSLGRPTAIYPLPDGERLQYSLQPAGVTVHNLDFDRSGHLVRIDQPLDPDKLLATIKIDQWTADDVRLLLGKPASVDHVARFDGDIWTYRFQGLNTGRFVHIHLDPSRVVRQILFTDEILVDGVDSFG